MLDKRWDWVPTDVEAGEAFARLDIGCAVEQAQGLSGSFNRIFRYSDKVGNHRVLRMRPRWMTENRMTFEHGLATHLADRGLPVLRPVSFGEDETWFRVGDIFCEAYPFVDGRSGRPVRYEAYLSGLLLGNFHRAASEFNRGVYQRPQAENQLDPWQLQSRIEVLRQFAAGERVGDCQFLGEPSLFDPLWRRWDRILAHYPQAADSAWTILRHGDFHMWNLLFSSCEPTQIAALLDLDMVAEGMRIYDVSYAIYFLMLMSGPAWCREQPAAGDAFDPWPALCRDFLRGYFDAGQLPLDDTEIAAVPLQMECVAAHFLSYNILRQTDSEAAEELFRADYLALTDWLDRKQTELLAVLAEANAEFGTGEQSPPTSKTGL